MKKSGGSKKAAGLARKYRCFVAMRFGEKDTDAIYDRVIVPTLKQLQVEDVRIDRRTDNQDINIPVSYTHLTLPTNREV